MFVKKCNLRLRRISNTHHFKPKLSTSRACIVEHVKELSVLADSDLKRDRVYFGCISVSVQWATQLAKGSRFTDCVHTLWTAATTYLCLCLTRRTNMLVRWVIGCIKKKWKRSFMVSFSISWRQPHRWKILIPSALSICVVDSKFPVLVSYHYCVRRWQRGSSIHSKFVANNGSLLTPDAGKS